MKHTTAKYGQSWLCSYFYICVLTQLVNVWSHVVWCCFQMSLEQGTNVIICIFMPNVQQRQLPGTLHLITKTVTCIKWSPDPNAQKVFWLMLYKGLVD